MTHQNLRLWKCWKLFWATLRKRKNRQSLLFNWATSTCEQCSASKWNRPFINQQCCGLVSVHCPSSSPQQGRKVCCTVDCDADRWLHCVFLHWAVPFDRHLSKRCKHLNQCSNCLIVLALPTTFFCLVLFLCVRNGGWGREGVWVGVTAWLSNNYRKIVISTQVQ